MNTVSDGIALAASPVTVDASIRLAYEVNSENQSDRDNEDNEDSDEAAALAYHFRILMI